MKKNFWNVWKHTHTRACAHTHTTHTRAHAHTCTHACTYTHTHACTHARTRQHTYKRAQTFLRVTQMHTHMLVRSRGSRSLQLLHVSWPRSSVVKLLPATVKTRTEIALCPTHSFCFSPASSCQHMPFFRKFSTFSVSGKISLPLPYLRVTVFHFR